MRNNKFPIRCLTSQAYTTEACTRLEKGKKPPRLLVAQITEMELAAAVRNTSRG